MKHLLAPVPAVHLPSALNTFEREGCVAFGSDAFDVLAPLRGQNVLVWIAASSTGSGSGGVPLIDIGKIVIRAQLHQITDADGLGQHFKPQIRPETTRTDDKFGLFWEVRDLERLKKAIPIGEVRTVAGKRLSSIPHGPTLIMPPDQYTP